MAIEDGAVVAARCLAQTPGWTRQRALRTYCALFVAGRTAKVQRLAARNGGPLSPRRGERIRARHDHAACSAARSFCTITTGCTTGARRVRRRGINSARQDRRLPARGGERILDGGLDVFVPRVARRVHHRRQIFDMAATSARCGFQTRYRDDACDRARLRKHGTRRCDDCASRAAPLHARLPPLSVRRLGSFETHLQRYL